jgi:hypothetical protein
LEIRRDDPLGRAAVDAIHHGDVAALAWLLNEHPGLANPRIGGPPWHMPGQPTRYSNTAITIADATIFPKEAFYPYFYRETFDPGLVTPSTFSVHHWAKR